MALADGPSTRRLAGGMGGARITALWLVAGLACTAEMPVSPRGGGAGAGPAGTGGPAGAPATGAGGMPAAAGSGGPAGGGAGTAAAGDSGAVTGAAGTGASVTGAAGTSAVDAGGPEAAPSAKIPIFVAQGQLGRTTISCDDGKTWVGNRSWDLEGDPLVCGAKTAGICDTGKCSYTVAGKCQQETCCYDTPDIAKGVIFGAGKFVATWGWGQPGAVRTSTNGIDWTTTHPNDSFGGIAFGGGRFVVASRSPFWSGDGTAWTAGQTADFRNADNTTMWSVRRFAYADFKGGGRFVAVASGNTSRDMLVSADGGVTWKRPSLIPTDCALEVSTYGGIVSGNGVIVIVDQHANACRSTDGGDTWSVVPTGLTQILSHGVWTGSKFLFWGDNTTMVSSPDGAAWTKTKMTTPLRLGPVALGPNGTFVAVQNVWDGYDKQHFLRSTDGLAWETLPAAAFVAGHPIFYIAFGYADPSAACPAR
jgi:hypothetical protein